MHILIVPSWYTNTYNEISGIFFKEQAEALAKHNNMVGIIALQEIVIKDIFKHRKLDFFCKNIIDDNLKTYICQYPVLPKFHTLRRKIKMYLFIKLVEQYIKENGLPDIIHLHSFIHGELVIYLKEKYNIPYVLTEHFSGFALNKISSIDLKRAKNIFNKSNYNIAVSKELKYLLENKFKQKFHYLPNIVNINNFNIAEKNDTNDFNFINIAFLNKNKNHSMLINSFYSAFKGKKNIKLTIVGDGAEYNNLKYLIKKLNMENQILLFGKANRNEVKLLLQKSDVFVLSSIYETFGVVMIEAMASGLPVLATRCGGSESIINSDKVGLLSKIDEIDFSDKLIKIYTHRSKFDSNYIRDYVYNNFSEEIICKKLFELYKKTINMAKYKQ